MTNLFGKLAATLIGKVMQSATMSAAEKAYISQDMSKSAVELEKEFSEAYKVELATRAEIIKTEMMQSDKFTKRARPAVVYVFLTMTFLNYTVLPFIASIFKLTDLQLVIPSEAWSAFKIVLGVYVVGRTFEKSSGINKITSAINKTKGSYE